MHEVKEKHLINITAWNDREIRIEVFGNGYYVPKSDVKRWMKASMDKIIAEVVNNMETK